MIQTYSYTDIGLVPRELSEIKSRDDIRVEMDFFGEELSIPILVAPMRTVVCKRLLDGLERVGGLACLPRGFEYYPGCYRNIPSFSLKEIETGYAGWSDKNKIICVDVANSFNSHVGDCIKRLKEISSDVRVISGNISSIEGYSYMRSIGVDAVRVGIGPGFCCTTSKVTGVSTGQASLIRSLVKFREENKSNIGNKWPIIIADGGITSSGDFVKAIALGADVVMMGSYFGGCEEAAGSVVKFKGSLHKQMAGEASFALRHTSRYEEGDDTLIPFSGKLDKIWHKMEDGLRSAMSYMGCPTLEQFRNLDDSKFCLLPSNRR